MPGPQEDFKSVLQNAAKQIETLDLEPAKELLTEEISKSKVNPNSKNKMISIIKSIETHRELLFYVWNAILKYKGEKVVSEDLEKSSSNLNLIIAQKLDEVAEMLEQARSAMPELSEGEIPIFIFMQEIPTFTYSEPTEMPDFNIRDLPIISEE